MRRGFTLIEVIVALVVISVIAAVTLPALARTPERDDGDPAYAVAAVIDTARTLSIQRGTRLRLVFDPSRDVWWLAGYSGESPVQWSGVVQQLNGSLKQGFGLIEYRISPTGQIAGPEISMTVSGTVRSLRIDPWTGAASVE